MRTLPEYFESDELYWLMDGFLMICVCYYIWTKSVKTVTNMIATVACGGFLLYNFIDCMMFFILKEPLPDVVLYVLVGFGVLVFYSMIAKNRFEWERQKSADYNKQKVQAVYSKPKMFLTMLGATSSLSPKCSVRYMYNGKMIRFKRGYPTPIMTKAVLKKTDIIQNTNIDPECFYSRYDEIKNKKYNLFNFNCKHLFKESYNNKVKLIM